MQTRTFKHLAVTQRDGITTLTLNRPPLNVLNIEMLREMNSALAAIQAEDSLKVLLLTAEGSVFSAGVDVAEHLPGLAQEMLSAFSHTIELLNALEVPVVAALNGPALGGGCELALVCDIVIAAESARLGQPEIKLGVLAPVAAVLLPRICGLRKAMELMLLGRVISAREAKECGLVNRVVPDGELVSQAESVIHDLATLSPDALKHTKRAVLENLGQKPAEALEAAEATCLRMLLTLADSQEGLRAFLENRAARWEKS